MTNITCLYINRLQRNLKICNGSKVINRDKPAGGTIGIYNMLLRAIYCSPGGTVNIVRAI